MDNPMSDPDLKTELERITKEFNSKIYQLRRETLSEIRQIMNKVETAKINKTMKEIMRR